MPSGDLHPMTGQDALSPADVAFLVETRGVTKATAPVVTTFVLGVVAGAFIALGGVFAITIGTGSELGFGPTRLLAGVGFSLGLILAVVAGAELFTGKQPDRDEHGNRQNRRPATARELGRRVSGECDRRP